MISEKLGRILRVRMMDANHTDARGFVQVDCDGP